jgi:hypothetical protein
MKKPFQQTWLAHGFHSFWQNENNNNKHIFSYSLLLNFFNAFATFEI